MSADINHSFYTGRMVKDVEAKSINSSYLITGCFASNRSYKKGDQWVEEASFFNFKVWVKNEKQKDFYVNHLKKGTQISIDGSWNQEHWEKDGQKQSAYVLYADKIIPAWGSSDSGSKSSNSGNGSSVPSFNADEGFPEDPVF